jgi:hypothetical protein
MLQTRIGEYWDSDRATYEDELNAWRERTYPAVPVVARIVTRRRVATRATLPRRPKVAPPRVRSSARRREVMTKLANQPSRDS